MAPTPIAHPKRLDPVSPRRPENPKPDPSSPGTGHSRRSSFESAETAKTRLENIETKPNALLSTSRTPGSTRTSSSETVESIERPNSELSSQFSDDTPSIVGMSPALYSARSSVQQEASDKDKLRPIKEKIEKLSQPTLWARFWKPKEKKELVFRQNKKLAKAIHYKGIEDYERLTDSQERREALLNYLIHLNQYHDIAIQNSKQYQQNIQPILKEMKRAYEEYQAIPHDSSVAKNRNIEKGNQLLLSIMDNRETSLNFLQRLEIYSTAQQREKIKKLITEIHNQNRNNLNCMADFTSLYLGDESIRPPEILADTVNLFNNYQFQAVIKATIESTPEQAEEKLRERQANFELMPETQQVILAGTEIYNLGYQISERLKEGRLRQEQHNIQLDTQENNYASILHQENPQNTTKEKLNYLDSEIKKTNSIIENLNQINDAIAKNTTETLTQKTEELKKQIEKLNKIRQRTQEETRRLTSLTGILEAIESKNRAQITAELKKYEEYLQFSQKQKEEVENTDIKVRLEKLEKDEQELRAALKSLKENETKIKGEIKKIDKLLLENQHQENETDEQARSVDRKRTALGNTLEQLKLRLRETDGIPKEIDTLERSINLVRRMRHTTILKTTIQKKSDTQRLINQHQKELSAIQKSLDHPDKRDPTPQEVANFGKTEKQVPLYRDLENIKTNREQTLQTLRTKAKNLDTLFEQELLRLQDQDADPENGKIPIDYWTPWLIDIGRDATGLGESSRRLGQEKDTILVREKLLADQGVGMSEAYQELGKSLTRIFNITDPKTQLKELTRLSRLPKWILDNPNLAREMIGNIQLALSELYASREGSSFKKIKEYIITDNWLQDILAASRESKDDNMPADGLAFLHITGYMPILIAAHRSENSYLGNLFGSVIGVGGKKIGDLIQGAFQGILTKGTAQGLARAYPGLGSFIESFENLSAGNDPLEVSKTFIKRSVFAEATRFYRSVKENGPAKALKEVVKNFTSWTRHASAGQMAFRSVGIGSHCNRNLVDRRRRLVRGSRLYRGDSTHCFWAQYALGQ